jgi:hypothetical protein
VFTVNFDVNELEHSGQDEHTFKCGEMLPDALARSCAEWKE